MPANKTRHLDRSPKAAAESPLYFVTRALRILSVLLCAPLICVHISRAHAQASAIPSAQSLPDTNDPQAGRKLLDKMVEALGGDAWLHRNNL